jgi:hypothetical protein
LNHFRKLSCGDIQSDNLRGRKRIQKARSLGRRVFTRPHRYASLSIWSDVRSAARPALQRGIASPSILGQLLQITDAVSASMKRSRAAKVPVESRTGPTIQPSAARNLLIAKQQHGQASIHQTAALRPGGTFGSLQ